MNKSILEKNYKSPIVTKETIENMKRYSQFYTGGSVRVQMGQIYTSEEFSKRSDEILSKKLPTEEEHILRKVFGTNKKFK